MTRPFGSIGIGAEMAASLGEDPRPYLTEEQIQEQLRISGMTRDEWNTEWERRLAVTALPRTSGSRIN